MVRLKKKETLSSYAYPHNYTRIHSFLRSNGLII